MGSMIKILIVNGKLFIYRIGVFLKGVDNGN